MTFQSRTAYVSASRMPGWLERFDAAHGGPAEVNDTDDGVSLVMRDGAVALLAAPWPDHGRPGHGKDLVERLISLAAQERSVGIILARQGNYAVGVGVGGVLTAHKVGTSSARSRGGDKNAAVIQRTVDQALDTLRGHSFEYLGTGGDKALIRGVLAAPGMKKFSQLPQLPAHAVPDPNMAVLTKAAADFASVRILITDAP